ncbi:MAG TPA: FMN-binding protein [Prolixibacteraceae bacterium]|nr:FMN-binding protein [Prolixibacteraceae bacterium]HQN93792.1 FMN-binding protein [Prolixibacteraceae bacterium]
MNRLILLLALLISLMLFSCNSANQSTRVVEGKSQSVYTNEPFVGMVTLTYHKEKLASVDFQIVDTLHNEVFGSDYEKHYPDNEEYRMQCRNDWQGVLSYPAQLVRKQDIGAVDAISGATWSYNLFSAAVKNALKNNK